MATAAIVILCTAPDEETAVKLARGLVDARLAACVNLVQGVRSFYRWKGAVQDEPEVQLVVKTGAARFDDVRGWLEEHHPYEVPEIIALPIDAGSASYLEWVDRQTS